MTRTENQVKLCTAFAALILAMTPGLCACSQNADSTSTEKTSSASAMAASDIIQPEQTSNTANVSKTPENTDADSEEPQNEPSSSPSEDGTDESSSSSATDATDKSSEEVAEEASVASSSASFEEDEDSPSAANDLADKPNSIPVSLNITEDYRPSFVHGNKSAAFQKYIVLHDTESDSDPSSVVDYWDGNGNLVAAHFVVGKDGSIVQCVPLDNIAHHAGFGDTGHDELYGVEDESRDDKLGTTPIGDWAADYGMNSYSVGIEMVHVGNTGFYPEEQLAAVDDLIAYIDAYYGFESTIIDHKAWRSGNSDTSPEFAEYLANYQTTRKHTA